MSLSPRGEGHPHRLEGWPVSEAQTWDTTAVPLRIRSDVSLYAGLTIVPGATLLLPQIAGMTVTPGGSLSAVGTEAERIRFLGEEAVASCWDGLVFWTNSAANELTYVEVAHGGRGSGSTDANAEVTRWKAQTNQLHYSRWPRLGAARWLHQYCDTYVHSVGRQRPPQQRAWRHRPVGWARGYEQTIKVPWDLTLGRLRCLHAVVAPKAPSILGRPRCPPDRSLGR